LFEGERFAVTDFRDDLGAEFLDILLPLPALRRDAMERAGREAGARLRFSFSAVSRLTSLLKLLFRPPAVSSWTSKASLFSSNFRNQSSQETSSRESPPAKPGKSRRIIPTSSPLPVFLTQLGFALRSSAQRRISSWSVSGRADAAVRAILCS
jgi:hypothetical protein